MRFVRLRLRTRIFAGFGMIIVLLLAIAAFGSYGLSVVGEEIDKMDGIAGNANRLQELALRMEMIQRGLAIYRVDADAASLKEVTDAEARAMALLEESAQNTLSEQRRTMFNGVIAKLRASMAKREHFVALLDTGLAERARLLTGSVALRSAVAGLADAASANDNQAEAIAATAVRSAVLAAETTSLQLLATQDPALVAVFTKDAATAREALSTLEQAASPQVRPLIPPLVASLGVFVTTADKASATLIEAEAVYTGQLRPELRDMQAVTGKLLERLLSGFNSTSAKAYAISSDTLTRQLGLSAAATIIGIILALLVARTISRPVNRMTAAMTRLASGDSGSEIPGHDHTDEIGEMARAVEVFRQQAIENSRLAAAQQREQAAKARRQQAMDMHTQDFGRTVSGVMEGFMTAADNMRQAASQVADGARQTRASTSSTVDGAMASSQDLNAVAAATEQMALSINEIATQVAHVTTSVQAAVDRATETDTKVAGLSVAADRIGDVVRIITEIASQTNLLALNATIEAARAGEAGKGFAVVAGEVKALAAQTARATDQIGSQIVAIRHATGEAVTAVREVGAAIGDVETVAAAIAAAVEEQAAATREITNSVQQVTAATAAAADSLRHVLSIAEATDASSTAASEASEEVGRTAETLRSEVTEFLAAMSRGDEAERRGYERIPADGARATLVIAGRPGVQATIQDISRGGMQVVHHCDDKIGTDAEITLPGGGSVHGRIARNANGSLGFAFRQDPGSLDRIDQTLAFIRTNRDLQAGVQRTDQMYDAKAG
jgi:methyl-accepting chemotaxis protein